MYINMYIMYIELAKGWTFHSPQTSHALAETNAPTSCRFSSIAVQASVAAEKTSDPMMLIRWVDGNLIILLVGGAITILKNISQWEGWHPIYYGQ